MKNKSVMVIAGEVSGDMHAAGVVRTLQAGQPDMVFFGIGGEELRKTGMEIFYDVSDTAVLGLTDVLLKYRFFKKAFREMLDLACARKPDVVLLVDYPGFNLRFAEKAHSMGLKVIYYICPQVWAWNRSRIPKMARSVDRLIAIFPFEKEVFHNSGLRVDVVRHPLVKSARDAWNEPEPALPWKGDPHIALLPGSRRHEVKRMLPCMWKAAAMVERSFPGAGFTIAAPNEEIAGLARAMIGRMRGGPASFAVLAGRTKQALRQARAAMVASGTATVESALMRCPMAVVYKTAWMTYFIGRILVASPYLGMVNIIAGKPLCPELIQHEAVPSRLAGEIVSMVPEGNIRSTIIEGLDDVIRVLSEHDDDAADIVLDELA